MGGGGGMEGIGASRLFRGIKGFQLQGSIGEEGGLKIGGINTVFTRRSAQP